MDTPLSIPHEDRLLLAFACCEWAGALTHLTALRQVGCRVSDDIVAGVEAELAGFASLWNQVHRTQWPPIVAAEQARAWLTEHAEELDALLKRGGYVGG